MKMRLALQRVADEHAFEEDFESVTESPQEYVDRKNAERKEGESEVILISAWQVGPDDQPAEPPAEPTKVEFFGRKAD